MVGRPHHIGVGGPKRLVQLIRRGEGRRVTHGRDAEVFARPARQLLGPHQADDTIATDGEAVGPQRVLQPGTPIRPVTRRMRGAEMDA